MYTRALIRCSLLCLMLWTLVGCQQGLCCSMASEDVGRATTRSVVYSIMLIYGANLLLTTLIFRG